MLQWIPSSNLFTVSLKTFENSTRRILLCSHNSSAFKAKSSFQISISLFILFLETNFKTAFLWRSVELKTNNQDEDSLFADNFIWNIDEANYLLTGNIRFENKNVILTSGKAKLDSDNIIEFFNPVKYIIKDENNENKYETKSENAYYDINQKSLIFKATNKRVSSKIYF